MIDEHRRPVSTVRERRRGREGERESGLEDGGTHIDSIVSLSTADEVVLQVLESPYCGVGWVIIFYCAAHHAMV